MANKLIKVRKTMKKSFYEVSAPLTETKIYLYSTSKENLDGKTVKLDLTKKLRGKSLELRLKVKLKGDKLYAEPESVELVGYFIRRIMRTGIDYVEDSFEADCRDYTTRIKIFLITRKRVSRAVLKALRENARKYLSPYIKTRTSKEIFSDIISNKLQKQLASKLKKIYPLALCEIRIFEIIKEKEIKKEETKEPNKKEEEKKDEKEL